MVLIRTMFDLSWVYFLTTEIRLLKRKSNMILTVDERNKIIWPSILVQCHSLFFIRFFSIGVSWLFQCHSSNTCQSYVFFFSFIICWSIVKNVLQVCYILNMSNELIFFYFVYGRALFRVLSKFKKRTHDSSTISIGEL